MLGHWTAAGGSQRIQSRARIAPVRARSRGWHLLVAILLGLLAVAATAGGASAATYGGGAANAGATVALWRGLEQPSGGACTPSGQESDTAPTVTGVDPSSGPSAGGTIVTIKGTNLSVPCAVDFGKAPALTPPVVVNASEITVTAPPGTGTVAVTVTTSCGTSSTSVSSANQYTYTAPAPTVTAISPSTGPATGGTPVTITGSGFLAASGSSDVTSVKFGSTPATAPTVVSATEITATSPPGSGTVDVTVTTAGGPSTTSSADQFSYQAAPSIAPGKPTSNTGPPSVLTATGAAFSGTVNPNGLQTTAHFEYGLDPRYTGSATVAYTLITASTTLGADFAVHPVSATVSGLLPNALYHVRLVATNSAGTTYGPDRMFTTNADPAPPAPVLGKSVDVKPVSGVVFVRLPHSASPYAAAHRAAVAPFIKGKGFVPLTETRRLPTGTQVDARRGTLNLVTATGQRHKTQTGTFSGAIFSFVQASRRSQKGLTTITLLEGLFPGAPSYATCKAHAASDNPTAYAAVSSRVLQALRASDHHGSFRTRGRYSAATVRGTVWGVRDRCDGTLTTVFSGTVLVDDFATGKTITLHAGHTFLARPAAGKH